MNSFSWGIIPSKQTNDFRTVRLYSAKQLTEGIYSSTERKISLFKME